MLALAGWPLSELFDWPLTQLVDADLGMQLTPALDIANRVPSLFVTPPTLENVSPLLSISIEGYRHVVTLYLY